jgi:hypothetical protein
VCLTVAIGDRPRAHKDGAVSDDIVAERVVHQGGRHSWNRATSIPPPLDMGASTCRFLTVLWLETLDDASEATAGRSASGLIAVMSPLGVVMPPHRSNHW